MIPPNDIIIRYQSVIATLRWRIFWCCIGRKNFLWFFEKMMRFCLEIFTLLLKAFEKLFWEIRNVRIKILNFFEKRYKNRRFQVWLQLKGTKNAQKASDLWKNKIFSNSCRKTAPTVLFMRQSIAISESIRLTACCTLHILPSCYSLAQRSSWSVKSLNNTSANGL